jgi:hypothetical protein
MALGGAVALVASLYGFYVLKEGLADISACLDTLGVPVGSRLKTLLSMTNYLVIPNFIIYIYGQREFVRRYDHKCTHGKTFLHMAVKWAIVKPVIGTMVVFTFLSCLITLIFVEAWYIMFLALDYTCDGTQDAIETLLDLMNSKLNVTSGDDDIVDGTTISINTVCDTLGQGTEGGEQATMALIILVSAQILTLGYWMKYSTIGAAPLVPFPDHPDDPDSKYRDKKDDAFYKKNKTQDDNKRRGSAAAFYNAANPPQGGRRGSAAPPPPTAATTSGGNRDSSMDRPPPRTQQEEDERIGREAREAVEKKRKEDEIEKNLEHMRKQAETLLKTPQELQTHEIELDLDDDNHHQVEKKKNPQPRTPPPQSLPRPQEAQSPRRPPQTRGASFNRQGSGIRASSRQSYSPPQSQPRSQSRSPPQGYMGVDRPNRAPRKY